MVAQSQPPLAEPLRIGRRWLVIPLDFDGPIPTDLVPLCLAASGVFGSGTHPTTQLCLMALERHLRAGATAVDIGTGTGILVIAAARLGASDIFACDIDPAAVAVAQENLVANGVGQQLRLQPGSLAEVLIDQSARGPADVVIVNILANIVESLFKTGLGGTVKPGGLLILSGLLPAQTAGIRACLQWYGLKLLAQEQRGEWVCLIAQRLPTTDTKIL